MLRFIVLFISTCVFTMCGDPTLNISAKIKAESLKQNSTIEIMPRILFLTQYPCMECHHEIEKKDKILLPLKQPHNLMNFDHMDNIKNCFLCHDRFNYDQLRLIDGSILSYNNSQNLCFQCHGEKKEDWEMGIHGQQIGKWNGKKFRDTCVECHDPHSPTFPQMKADPPPPFPKLGINKHGMH